MRDLTRTIAVGLAALSLSAFQAVPNELPPRLAALAEDVTAAREFDYMSLKAEGADVRALSAAAFLRTRIDADNWRCLTEAETEMLAGLSASAEAADAAAFAADRASAEAAWARWQAFEAQVMGGAAISQPPFRYVADRVAMAEAATGPRARELLRRAARDQLLRRGWDPGPEVWPEPPSPGASSRYQSLLRRQACEVDSANTAWLKADVEANGWYRISVHGEDATGSAWLMAQHADRDRAFQRHVLGLLEPLAAEGEVRAANHAYLYDRLAVAENRPQRYGTQGQCAARGVWEPFELEDASRTDNWREQVDIGPLADYAAHMAGACADFED